MSGYLSCFIVASDYRLLASVGAVGKNVDLFGYVLFVSLFVLALYTGLLYFGKKLNRMALPGSGLHTRTVPLGMDKRVIVFEIEGVSYVVYMDKQHTILLDKRTDLSDAFFDTTEPHAKLNGQEFNKVLGSILKRQGTKNE